ncbi:Na+/H+ antiporter NhaA [Herbidospora yilanensis]|uniref:Na+/H+ antiporter NhaA n=1 Tax=Herbidospora yilanensis TaxID=354426 RepID=UPI000785F204|nr:Na+/H+ antiporter NhaA [Herbidospora yilanensis]
MLPHEPGIHPTGSLGGVRGAGVPLNLSALGGVFTDRIALGVLLRLVVGKFVGVFGGVFGDARLSVRPGFARISADLVRRDIAAASVLAGIGFAVSPLIGDRAHQGKRHRIVAGRGAAQDPRTDEGTR